MERRLVEPRQLAEQCQTGNCVTPARYVVHMPTADHTPVHSAYHAHMGRDSIVIDDELLSLVMRQHGLISKTEAIEFALRRLADAPMTTEEKLAMHGANLIDHVPEDKARTWPS